ncbi:hypothetical protein [Kitasatospora sp. HPMI-4]
MTAEEQAAAVRAAQEAADRAEAIRLQMQAELQRHGQTMTQMGVGQ